MELSPKALRFLIDALKLHEEHFERCMQAGGLADDELADLANDRQYLLALRQDLQSRHDELLRDRETLPSRI